MNTRCIFILLIVVLIINLAPAVVKGGIVSIIKEPEVMNSFDSNSLPNTGEHQRRISITQSVFEETILLQGDLDSKNSSTRELSQRLFDPVKRINICNAGKSKVQGIKLVNNGFDLYSELAIVKLLFAKALNEKDSILAVYKFMQDYRIHDYNASVGGNRIGESYNKQRLLTTYGYGLCDANMWNSVYLFQAVGRSTQNIGMVHHTLMQAKTESGFAICDADTEGFYLNYDNSTLCDFFTVRNDRFLIDRVKHYGAAQLQKNTKQSWIYEESAFMGDNQVPFDDIQWDGSFDLYPNEILVFSPDVSELKYQHDYPIKPNRRSVEMQVVNAALTYKLDLDYRDKESPITFDNCIFDALYNGKVLMGANSVVVYSRHLQFPIVDASLSFKIFKPTEIGNIIVLFSIDSVHWDTVWKQEGVFEGNEEISFASQINPINNRPILNVHIKIITENCNEENAYTIDSLAICTTFQTTRQFWPQFTLGENILVYSDHSEDRDIVVEIDWIEADQIIPNRVVNEIFPENNSSVDSLYFSFHWEAPESVDASKIVDYEFFLSDDPNLKYPLSPNFNKFVSSLGDATCSPSYKVQETGWLNDGQTYYWRVRAKDARGAWSEWSDTWSFTAHGLMRPVNPSISVDHDKQVMCLSWEDNPQGKQAEFYKIYATNESNGFYPEPDVVVATTQIKEYCVPFEASSAPLSFYRVTACDSSGQESLCSDVAELPYPRIYSYRDSLRDGAIFEWDVAANTRFYPYFLYEPCTTWFEPSVSILDMPAGFEYDLGLLKCTDTLMAHKLLFTPESKRTVRFQMDDHEGGLGEQEFVMWSAAENRIPELQISHNEGCENSQFSAFIASIDGDVQLGDSHHYSLVQLPSWMEYRISNDTIHLFGIASLENAKDTLIEVQVEDSKSATETFRTAIRIWPSIQIESQNIDTAFEDQIWHYRPFLKHLKEYSDISVCIQKKPQWIINIGLNFFGVLSKDGLTDTILEYSITDAHCQDTQRISIPIKPTNHAPVVQAPLRTFVWEDSLFQEPMRYWDSDSSYQDQELRFEIVPSGLWLNVDSIDGVLSGTPQRKDSLDTRFCVHIKDIEQDSGSVCFELTILRPNLMTLIDTLLIRDTLIHIDTIYRCDTLIRMDTLWKIDTLLIQDTLIYTDTLLRVDTLVQRDSILITNTITDTLIRVDTLWRSDTLYVTDTIIKTDTLYFFDTIYLHDTILVQIRPPQTSQNQYTLYQNDSNGKVQVEAVIQNSVSVHYAIYTLHGQRLFLSGSRRLGSGTEYIPIDMGSYPSGIYILSLFEDGFPCFHVKISKTQ